MNLGETIYKLRMSRNLSQGDLAEKLNVSRQSISKWENNSAVPDLEKIVKLSEIFEVTLDELVKGEGRPTEFETPVQETANRQITEQQSADKAESHFPSRKLAGIILFCMAFLVTVIFLAVGGGLAGVILALPFLICGIICFTCKKNIGLWCAWAVFVCVYIYILFATGIRVGNILYTLRWTAEMNYIRLIFAWLLFIAELALMIATVGKLRKNGFRSKEEGKKKLLVSWLIFAAALVFSSTWPHIFKPFYEYLLTNVMSVGWIFTLVSIVTEGAEIITITVALTNTARFVRQRKEEK